MLNKYIIAISDICNLILYLWFFGDKYEKFIIKGNKNADLAF